MSFVQRCFTSIWCIPRLLSCAIIILFAFWIIGDYVSHQPVLAQANLYCVHASIISHDERPLGAGFNIEVSATDPTYSRFTGTTNSAGLVRFDLPAGEWSFSLQLPENYKPITKAQFSIVVEPTFTECQEIRFKIMKVISVTVIKLNQEHQPVSGWEFRAEPGAGDPFAKALPSVARTDANGRAQFLLTEGLWIFSEPLSNERVTPVTPLGGKIDAMITDPGPHTIYFKNKIEDVVCINVTKIALADPDSGGIDFPLADWEITLLRADGTEAGKGRTDINGRIRFGNLPEGPYTVVEQTRIGWKPAGPTRMKVYPTPGACEQVTFENYQDHSYCIEGTKIDQNGNQGLPGWIITAEPLDRGGFKPDDVVTDGLGKFRFDLPQNDYRIPGSRYRVCEVPQNGWMAVTEVCQEVKIWPDPGMCEVLDPFINKQTEVTPVPIPEVPEPESKEGFTVPSTEPATAPESNNNSVGSEIIVPAYEAPLLTLGQPTSPIMETAPSLEPRAASVAVSDASTNTTPVVEAEQIVDEEVVEVAVEEPVAATDKTVLYASTDAADVTSSELTLALASYSNATIHQPLSDCSRHHVVMPGEGLYEIGTTYGKSAQEMLDANPDVRSNRRLFVYVGQQLCIP